MKKATGFAALICLSLLFIAQTAMAQKVSVPVHLTDGVGAVTIKVGFNPAATNGIDPALGEEEQPELPPSGAFDGRSISILSGLGTDVLLGGVLINYHLGTALNQPDRWRFEFKSDSTGGPVTFTWPSHLSDSAGGKWLLQDASGEHLFSDVDMTTQTSFTHPRTSLSVQYIFIKVSDKVQYRTFVQTEIANAVNSAGKHAIEKRKPYASYGCFQFANSNAPGAAMGLHVEFDQAVMAPPTGGSAMPVSFAPFTSAANPDGKGKAWNFTTPSTPVGASVTVCAFGNKGKGLAAKKWWWLNSSSAMLGAKMGAAPVVSSYLLLKMPNPLNVLQELYTEGPPLPVGLPTSTGKNAGGKDVFKQVTHPKWTDVLATLYKKGPHTGDPRCLDVFTNLKPIEKVQKSLTAGSHNNKLLAEAVALKFNIAASRFGNTTPGLGEMTYVGGTYDGLTLQHIAELADTGLACVANAKIGGNLLGLYNTIRSINIAFSGPFDTTGFLTKTVVKGVGSVTDVSYLHKSSEQIPIVITKPFVDPNPIPESFTLRQNYPNPFNPTTTIEFALPADAIVTLKVYNILGQEMTTLFDHEALDAGTQFVDFDASNLPSGVYFYRVVAQSVNEDGLQNSEFYTSVKKMMLLK